MKATSILAHSQLLAKMKGTEKWLVKTEEQQVNEEHLNRFWALLDEGLPVDQFLLGISITPGSGSAACVLGQDYLPEVLPQENLFVSSREETEEDITFNSRKAATLEAIRSQKIPSRQAAKKAPTPACSPVSLTTDATCPGCSLTFALDISVTVSNFNN